ncbi:hypothetical protein [Rubellicoccus peritrichatus]|uniref:Uncharacterized protein n=1 Tax=Rubellicoccus peritrichatus TaxID=3080537 RepID=A0AAQ3QVP8_9BACT|nr:hypothetical protein [Puniceicoccus sp. CR14]WOO43591.1 hypothetical protein RZN69_10875 [Puniceicoccus sp. CR14]
MRSNLRGDWAEALFGKSEVNELRINRDETPKIRGVDATIHVDEIELL